MSGKGSISRMSDECLMTLEFGIPFYIVYQAVMRKFTLAGKSTFLHLIHTAYGITTDCWSLIPVSIRKFSK